MIGAGYVGLTSAVCLAKIGHSVTCVDIDRARIALLDAGGMPIYEPGLAELIAANRFAGRLSFSIELREAARDAEAIFIAVGTPSRSDGSVELSYIEAAARQLAPVMRRGGVVIVKSTVPPGTARHLRELIGEARGALDFCVASNPEFLREGSAVSDFLNADRIVVGADDPRARRLLEQIYLPLSRVGVPCLFTSTVNAETTKYAANALLALRIGFINEIADLCERIGGDVHAVAQAIGLDHRIGPDFLAAGPGFGGSCFPKDTRALAAVGRQSGTRLHLVETLIERNEIRKAGLAQLIVGELDRPAHGARIALLGVAFKADTDDVRESPALSIIPLLQEAGCEVRVHDPKARAPQLLGSVTWCDDPYEAAEGADIAVILTEWAEYRDIDLERLGAAMASRKLFDCRNLIDPAAAVEAGFRYIGIGRGSMAARKVGAVAARAGRPAARPMRAAKELGAESE